MSQDDLIDATNSNSIEEASHVEKPTASKVDPAMSVTIALANELQQVYANDQQKLDDMNRSLRAAFKGKTK